MKWEYKVVEPDDKIETQAMAEAHLNQYGNEGWELVQIIDGYAFFKRQKRVMRQVSQMEALGG
jgi:hypothetical protein